MSEELSCQELVELVTAYFDDALPAAERARFDEHLTVCPGCATYVAQLRETVRLTGSLREESLDPTVRDTLLAQFRNWKDSSV